VSPLHVFDCDYLTRFSQGHDIHCDQCPRTISIAQLIKDCEGDGWEENGWALHAWPLLVGPTPLLKIGEDNKFHVDRIVTLPNPRSIFMVAYCPDCSRLVRHAIYRAYRERLRAQGVDVDNCPVPSDNFNAEDIRKLTEGS
jgi:hypothetical protein